MTLSKVELQKKNAGYKACEYVKDGMTLGLGTGSTAYYAIIRCGELIKEGFDLKAVATSQQTAEIAKENGVPIFDVDEVDHIDLAIDGVDEIDREFNAIKGGGGALFREKIVANLAEEVIWIMDENKPVEAIGNFPLPVEILIYGHKHTLNALAAAGLKPVLREKNGKVFVTDNGNYIADLQLAAPLDIAKVKKQLTETVGVVETGLFLNMCDRMVMGTEDGAKVVENPGKKK